MTSPAPSSRDAAQTLRNRLQAQQDREASWRSPERRAARLNAHVERCLRDLSLRWSVTADVRPFDADPSALWVVRHRELRPLTTRADDDGWAIGWHPREHEGATIDPDWLWSPDGAAVRSAGELRIGDRQQIWVLVTTPVDPDLLIVTPGQDGSEDLRRLAVAARRLGRRRIPTRATP